MRALYRIGLVLVLGSVVLLMAADAFARGGGGRGGGGRGAAGAGGGRTSGSPSRGTRRDRASDRKRELEDLRDEQARQAKIDERRQALEAADRKAQQEAYMAELLRDVIDDLTTPFLSPVQPRP